MFGCKAWMTEYPMGTWEGLVIPVLDASLNVVDDAGDREHQGFLEALPEAHLLQGMGALIEGVNKALCTQQWWGHPDTETDQHMWEGASKWKWTYQSLKMEKWRIL